MREEGEDGIVGLADEPGRGRQGGRQQAEDKGRQRGPAGLRAHGHEHERRHGEVAAEVLHAAGRPEEDAGERQPPPLLEAGAVEAVKAGCDEERQRGIDIRDGGQRDDDRAAEVERRGEQPRSRRPAPAPIEQQRRRDRRLHERHEVCRRVACQQEERCAEQLVQLREHGKANAPLELQRLRPGQRADERQVIERLVERQRRPQRHEEEQRKERPAGEERHERNPCVLGRREPHAQRTADDPNGDQRHDRADAKLSCQREHEQHMSAERQSERGAECDRMTPTHGERARSGDCEQQHDECDEMAGEKESGGHRCVGYARIALKRAVAHSFSRGEASAFSFPARFSGRQNLDAHRTLSIAR